ncbi:MAG TPA: VCBS repeat-containing protein [Thermoanaerobaculia bacterium]|nr:VCBS repeat-containing protein [Thermoanaerobaculia bacterium]
MNPRDPLLAAALVVAAAVPLGAQAPMTYEVVDANGPQDPWGKSAGDLDGDGVPELLVQGNGGDLVYYVGPGWAKQTIDAGGSFSTDLEVVRVDADADADVVSIAVGELRWYEAPTWTPHTIDSRTLHDVEVADFDLDGDVDLVARNQGGSGDALHLYRQDSPTSWFHRSLAIPAGEGLAVADVDRDGDLDIVVEARWIENPRSLAPTATWQQHVYSTTWTQSATFVATGDLNGDGRVDVVLSPSESAGGSFRISWFEAPPNPENPWTGHPIENPVESVHHFVGVADLDGDGDLDVASAEMHQGSDPDEVKVFWNGGAGASWVKQVLATTGSHSMRLVDVDADGDVDLFGANWSGGHQTVELWRNGSAIFVDGFESGDTARWSAVGP